jgi:putative Mg2+ transporter-C (MgtC) family protein
MESKPGDEWRRSQSRRKFQGILIIPHLNALLDVVSAMTDPFAILPHFIALSVAYGLALPIGWNREREERSAGLRTFPLVAVASCGFVQAVETMMADDPAAIARVLEGVIAGIGFLGGGAILQQKHSVKGTATAASLWTTGAIGVAAGLGSFDVAVALTLFVLFTLWVMAPLKPDTNERDENATDRAGDGSDH